jgi:hypothetical protein
MAKPKGSSVQTSLVKPKISRPGVHAKSKTSNSKNSKNYVKKYRGQGN